MSNGGLLKNTLSNNAPKSYTYLLTVGVILDNVSPIAIDCDMFLIPPITRARLSERLIEDAVMDLNDANTLVGVSDNDILVDILLCDCNDCAALSVNVIMSPLDVSNGGSLNNAVSNSVLAPSISTKYCSLVSNTTGSNLLFVLSNSDVIVTDTD